MKMQFQTPEDIFMIGTNDCVNFINQMQKIKGVYMIFCRNGRARITIDLQEYLIEKNAQTVLLPGTIITFNWVSEDFSFTYLSFTQNIFNEVTAQLDPAFYRFMKENPTTGLPEHRIQTIEGIFTVFRALHSDRENRFREQMFRNYIQSFLLDIYDKTHRRFLQSHPDKLTRQQELYRKYILLVQKHCTCEREVEFYADKLCITARYLSTLVHNVGHTTAKSIIDKYVILELKALIQSGKFSIQEISNQMNFSNASLLAQYFKRHTGVSPMGYRNGG